MLCRVEKEGRDCGGGKMKEAGAMRKGLQIEAWKCEERL